MGTTLQQEALFGDLSIHLETIDLELKLWNKYDTIWCMESTNEKKDGIVNKVIETIKTIIRECKRIINKTLESIGNHIRYGLLSPKKKEEFKRFQQFASEHPEVKKKKVKVKDWQKIMREYDKVEKNIVSMMNDKTVDAKGLNLKANELIENLTSVANSATAAVTVDMCMVFARQSPESAKQIEAILTKCNGVMSNIETQLGNKEAVKLQKNIHALTKESAGQRILAGLYHKKEKDMLEVLTEVSETFNKLMSGEATLGDKAKAAVQHRDLVRTAGKSYVKNKRTREGIKNIKDIGDYVKNDESISSIASTAKEFIKPTV